MKNKVTILGSGSSMGSPWINNYWGNCDKKNIKNVRTRCSVSIQINNLDILIDTSPDIRMQLQKNKIKKVDAVIYTHEHADQTAGIFELRTFYMLNKKIIPIYANESTMKRLKKSYPYLFNGAKYYPPILKLKKIKKKFYIKNKNDSLLFNSINVTHGKVQTNGYLFNKIAYISDCKSISNTSLKILKNLEYLIIDCFRYKEYLTHLSFDESLEIIKFLNPKKAILTNLHVDLDYATLKKSLPKNIMPAYDGLTFNF